MCSTLLFCSVALHGLTTECLKGCPKTVFSCYRGDFFPSADVDLIPEFVQPFSKDRTLPLL